MKQNTSEEVRTKICKVISDMLDNPNEFGIYPTGACYDALEGFIAQREKEVREEVLRDILKLKFNQDTEWGVYPAIGVEWKETPVAHINPNCKDSSCCKPHGEAGAVNYDLSKVRQDAAKGVKFNGYCSTIKPEEPKLTITLKELDILIKQHKQDAATEAVEKIKIELALWLLGVDKKTWQENKMDIVNLINKK